MTSILADGATDTVYIQDTGGGTIQRKINNGSWTTLSSWPVTITNTNPGISSVLKILFETDITLNSDTEYFVCGSAYLQFGSVSLDSQGNRRSITIDGVTSYPGLIQNGTGFVSGKANISVYNLSVSPTNSATLADYGGWIGQQYFGYSATGSVIVNCTSSGDISLNGGGIVGLSAGSGIGGGLTLRGCSSEGAIASYAGGIAGTGAGGSYGSITCEQCWSTGPTIASEGGGVLGALGGSNHGSAVVTKCYSTGVIQNDAGGIYGGNAGDSFGQATAQNCYSRGDIQGNGGGIFSILAAKDFGTTIAVNCYSSGSLATTGYGIYGANPQVGATSSQCYTANSSWSDSSASTSLTGTPVTSDVGTTWVKRGSNVPYELNTFGATPYAATVINSSGDLIQTTSQTISAGQSSSSALNADASGNAFSILQKTGGTAASYSTITISAQTGAISTTSATVPGTYTLTIRSIGSYFITTFVLTVSPQATPAAATTTTQPCCVSTMDERGLSYEWINDYKIGNRLILEVSQNPKTTFDGYSEYIKYKMAKGARKY